MSGKAPVETQVHVVSTDELGQAAQELYGLIGEADRPRAAELVLLIAEGMLHHGAARIAGARKDTSCLRASRRFGMQRSINVLTEYADHVRARRTELDGSSGTLRP